mgnify:FL=1
MAGKNDVSGDIGAARGKEAKRVGGSKLKGGSTPPNKLKRGK